MNKWFGRLPVLSGAIFAIVGFARGGGDDAAPTETSTGQQIAVYAYHHGLPGYLYNVELWTFLSLVVFSLVLYSRLRPAEPKASIAAQLVVAACVVSVAIKLSSFPSVYALYSSPVQLEPGVARSMWELGSFSFIVSMLVQSLSLGAVAVSGLLFGGIPRWLAGTAGAIAIALAAGFTLGGNFPIAPTLAWMLWLLVASVALFIRGPIETRDAEPARAAMATA